MPSIQILLKSLHEHLQFLTRENRFPATWDLSKEYYWDSDRSSFVVGHLRFMDALYLVRSELEVILDNLPDFLPGLRIRDVVSFISTTLLWPMDKFVSFAKYHTAVGFAMFLRDEIPVNPSLEFFPSKFSFLVWEGRVRKILRNRLMGNPTHSSGELFWAFLQGVKRGSLKVGPEFILKSLKDHVIAMSTPPPSSSVDLVGLVPLVEAFLPRGHVRKIKRDQEELDKNLGVMMRTHYEVPINTSKDLLYEPSPAAAVENKRVHGGGREYIRGLLMDEQGLGFVIPSHSKDRKGRSLATLHVEEIDLFRMIETRPGKVESIYRSTPSVSHKKLVEKAYENVDSFEVFSPNADAIVSAVLEPLKVRLITKTEAFTTASMQFLQKFLWKYLNTRPQFVLTGRPLVQTDFFDLLDRESLIPNLGSTGFLSDDFNYDNSRFSFWNSGDYKAATDNLDINLTKTIMETVLIRTDLTDQEKVLARRILYEQRIIYPSDYSKELEPFLRENGIKDVGGINSDNVAILQRNGQLMGSVLSFPILCIANLVCYWHTLRIYLYLLHDLRSHMEFLSYTVEQIQDYFPETQITSKTCPLWMQVFVFLSDVDYMMEDIVLKMPIDWMSYGLFGEHLPVLVNGDDILFRSNKLFDKIWENYGYKTAGFQKSVGKNYLSRDYLTINSECFHVHYINPMRNLKSFKKLRYLNTSVLMGNKSKYTLGVDLDPFKAEGALPINDQYNLLVTTCVSPKRAHNRFMHYRQTELRSFTNGYLNFFGSMFLGGLGAIPAQGLDLKKIFTLSQRKIASKLYSVYQGFFDQWHSLPFQDLWKRFMKLTYVDVNRPKISYPSRGGHFIRFKVSRNTNHILDFSEKFYQDRPEPPTLFSSFISGEKMYEIEGPSVHKLRKLVKTYGSLLWDEDVILFFNPRIIIDRGSREEWDLVTFNPETDVFHYE